MPYKLVWINENLMEITFYVTTIVNECHVLFVIKFLRDLSKVTKPCSSCMW
jgi:hypothetical protein